MGRLKIRRSTDFDRTAISAIYLNAFGPEQGREIVELVNGLFSDGTAKPLLSLVAETDKQIVGHILFTQARLQPKYQDISVRILAPLAVAKDFQGQAIGRSLVVEGLKRLTEAGVDLVFVLGHPDYYPKFGFRPAGVLGFEAPYPIPTEHANAWMVKELRAGVIGNVQGKIECAGVLDKPKHWQE
ncbi:GNAT family N-acetyltransferase [Thiohalomonas denitrificans]|uniref:GNAT family N-acetyltransferase n=1 Tax=Thiohalomonas denitrificans TaxID=415747 RepID=UPI0026F2DDD1|nr:N-acetyltransferase [Thiohalomonas denitrificans]